MMEDPENSELLSYIQLLSSILETYKVYLLKYLGSL